MMTRVAEDKDLQQVAARLQWPAALPSPLSVNQFALNLINDSQGSPDELVLTLGHAAPPIILGTDDANAEQLLTDRSLTITPVGRFSLTLARAKDLLGIMEKAVQAWHDAEALRNVGNGDDK